MWLAGTGSERSVQKEVAVVVQIYCFLMAVKERRSWRRRLNEMEKGMSERRRAAPRRALSKWLSNV